MVSIKTILFILFLSIFSFSIHAQDNSATSTPNITTMEKGVEYPLKLNKGEATYFQYTIIPPTPSAPLDYDISISATPKNYGQDPDIFVSKQNQYPNSTDTSEYYAMAWGFDLITIPLANLTENQTFYIGFVCASVECQFIARLQYTNEIQIDLNEDISMRWNETSTKLLRLYIPPEDPEKIIEHMIFYAELINPFVVNAGFHMYIKKGNDIPTSNNHDITAEQAWFDGKAAVIYANNSKFCTDCNYTILIEAQDRSLILFGSKSYGHVLDLNFGKLAYDAVGFRKNVTYKLNMTDILNDDKSSLDILFTPYYGKGLLFIHPDSIPSKFEDYKWNITEHGRERITISHKDLIKSGLKEVMYITVYGKITCTYSLEATNFNSTTSLIEFGTPQQGFVQKNEVQNYHILAWGDIDYNVTINLNPEAGNPDLYIKSCSNRSECFFTKNEIKDIITGEINPTSDAEYPFLLVSNNTNSAERIKFLHNGTVCSKNSKNNTLFLFGNPCYYAVGVISGSKGESRYTLIGDIEKMHRKLREGISIKSHLSQKHEEYYMFNVADDSVINKVKFQITLISGEVNIYISQTEPYPNSTINDQVSYYNDLITFSKVDLKQKNKTLVGNYYITISGYTDTTYSITPYIEYNDDYEIDSSVIKLWEGIPQKHVMNSNDVAYFSFKLNHDKDEENADINIILKPITGYYTMYVTNNGTMPTNETFTWITYGDYLIISAFDPNFNFDGIYYVAVYSQQYFPVFEPLFGSTDVSNPKMSDNTKVSFIISFVSSSNLFTLQAGLPQRGTINNEKPTFFKIDVLSEDSQITVTKLASSDNFELYLSTMETNPFPNATSYNYSTENNSTNVINLDQAEVQKNCPITRYMCTFYLSAITTSEDDIDITVMFTKKQSYIQLDEGKLLTVTVPEVNEYTKFYYYPAFGSKLANININPHRYELQAYANIIDTSVYTSKINWPYPTSENSTWELPTERFKTSELIIAPQEFEFCSTVYYSSCVMIITIMNPGNIKDRHHLNGSENLINPHWKAIGMTSGWDTTFTIMASSEIQQILPGKTVSGTVFEKSYRYYNLKVNRAACNLLISLTGMSDYDVKLYVSYGDKIRPTRENYDFVSSTGGRSQILSITNDDIIPRSSMAGDWVIAVYGEGFASFTLSVSYEASKVIKLSTGIPLEFEIKKGDQIYFEYFHAYNESLIIRLTKEHGSGTMYINPYKIDSGDFTNHLPNNTNYIWGGSSSSLFHETVAINPDFTNFCSNCYYLIKVQATSTSLFKFNIYLSNRDEFINLVAGKPLGDHVAKNSYQYYQFNLFYNNMIDINIIPYSGSPRVYAHHNPTVNKTNYLWKGILEEDQETNFINLRIDAGQLKYGEDYDSRYWDGEQYYDSRPNVIYIAVHGADSQSSDYSITLTTRNSTNYLIGGRILYGFLFPGESNTYIYTSHDNALLKKKKHIKLLINTYNDEFLQYKSDEETLPKFEISAKYKKFSVGKVEGPTKNLPYIRKEETMHTHSDKLLKSSTLYQYPNEQGKYVFVIQNPSESLSLNYSIVINHNEIYQLPLNTYQLSRILVGDEDIYEINVDKSGILAIELYECFGQIKLKATKSYYNMVKQIFDIEPEKHDKKIFVKLEVDPGLIYLSIKGIKGMVDNDNDPTEEALYKLNTRFFKKKEYLPYDSFIPGDQGHVKWISDKDDGHINIEWSNVELIEESYKDVAAGQKLDINMKYKVVITKDPILTESLSKCDYIPKDLSGAFSNKPSYFKTLLYSGKAKAEDENDQDESSTFLDSSSKNQVYNMSLKDQIDDPGVYYASIVALASGKKGSKIDWEFPIIYQTVQFEVNEQSNAGGFMNNTWTIILISIAAVVLVGIAIVMIINYSKYKTTRARLNYEMADVRNVANLSY